LGGFRRLELSQAIAAEAVSCRRSLALKLPDAVILATARCHRLQLVTRNTRDFPEALGTVLVPYRL
jgi:predicted nucleic acid-binding protein